MLTFVFCFVILALCSMLAVNHWVEKHRRRSHAIYVRRMYDAVASYPLEVSKAASKVQESRRHQTADTVGSPQNQG